MRDSVGDLRGEEVTGRGAWSGEDEYDDVTPHASGRHWDYSWGHHQNLEHRAKKKNNIERFTHIDTLGKDALKEYSGQMLITKSLRNRLKSGFYRMEVNGAKA